MTTGTGGEGASRERRESVNLEISNEMVRIYKELFGRGPTKAQTHWVGDDVVTVLMEDTLTTVERSLVNLGQHQRLLEQRMFFQYATVRSFCEPIETITGRKVRAFFSSLDPHVDGMAAETFVLYAKGEDGPSRIELGSL